MPRTLTGARVWLRPPEVADAPAVFAFAGDARVTRYLEWPMHVDRAETRDLIEDMRAGWLGGDAYCWAITLAATARLVGTVGCHFDSHGAELGFVLARDVWGRGLAGEAAALVVNRALAIDDIHRCWAVCDTQNTACARVLEKIGMRHEGVLRRYCHQPNRAPASPPRDVHVYARVR